MKKINYKQLFSKYPEIISAYLFGSRARGNPSPISDFDFAVQIDKKVKKDKYTDLMINLINDLCRKLKSDKVDVVILSEAPILLQHRILCDRKVIYCRSQLQRIRNEVRILMRYLDEKEYEMAFAKGIFKRILEAA